MFGQPSQQAFCFESESFVESLNRLLYVVEAGEPFVSFSGTDGVGRTTLLRRLRDESQSLGYDVTFLNAAAMDEHQILHRLCCQLADAESRSEADVLRLIRDEVLGRSLCRHRTVIILDDLHLASGSVSSVIRFLTATAEQTDGFLCTVATVDRRLASELASLSALRVELRPLNAEDSIRFVTQQLTLAGVDMQRLTDDGIQRMVEFGCGCPARLVRICEVVRVALATDNSLIVDAMVVDALSGETLLSRAG